MSFLPPLNGATAQQLALGVHRITAQLGMGDYAVGDVLYATDVNTLDNLAGVATGNALISGGVATAPAWGKIGLTTHVSGTLPVANGGTGDTGTTWASYTPTLGASSGSLTSASATAASKTIGKTTFVSIAVVITTNGTAAGVLTATLPNTATRVCLLTARRSPGQMCIGVTAASSNVLSILDYASVYPGGDSVTVNISGVYENT